VQILFWDHLSFISRRGTSIDPETTIKHTMWPQEREELVNKIDSIGSAAQIASESVLSVNVISALMTGSIQQLLGIVRGLQISLHMLLVDVATPAIVNIFFYPLAQLVSADLV